MKRIVMQDEREEDISEPIADSMPILGYTLEYLDANQPQIIQKVQVRNVNIQDILRHLQQGDSVLITPKIGNLQTNIGNQAQSSLYFAHV